MSKLCVGGGYWSGAKKLFTGLIVAVLAATVLVHPRALAADTSDSGLNLIVSSLPVSLQVKPGGSVSTQLQVKNGNTNTEALKVTLMKFGAEGEDGTPKLLDPQPGDESLQWVKFSESHFTAEPNVWKTITMTISVPPAAAFSYDYAVVFSRDGTQPSTAKQAQLLGAVATLVMVDVQRPGAKSEAQVVQFSMPKKIYEFLPATFTVRMRNTGNTHLAPRGNIFITKGNPNGPKIGLLEVNQAKGYILPGTYRTFTAQWQDGAPAYTVKTADGKVVLDKNDKPESKLDWSNFTLSKLRFGRYTAHLLMVYNNGSDDIPVEGVVSFWVIPWRILAGVSLVAVLMLAGLYALIVRPLRAQIKRRKRA